VLDQDAHAAKRLSRCVIVAGCGYRARSAWSGSRLSAEQVTAWVPGRWDAEQEHRRCGNGRLVLVAADEPGRVVAFIDREPDGHIGRLFCAPEAAGRGIASRLYEALETAARAQGIKWLFTEASEPARRFFERKGFTVLQRQDKVLRGVPIHNYRMAKTLG
jgi:putative acetyltransferase